MDVVIYMGVSRQAEPDHASAFPGPKFKMSTQDLILNLGLGERAQFTSRKIVAILSHRKNLGHNNKLAPLGVWCALCIVLLKSTFFFSLALSDLLVGAVVMPLALINDLSAHGWRFGQDFCKIWIASDVMCSTASILNLMAISFDRY